MNWENQKAAVCQRPENFGAYAGRWNVSALICCLLIRGKRLAFRNIFLFN